MSEAASNAKPFVTVEQREGTTDHSRRLRFWVELELDDYLWETLADLKGEDRKTHPYLRMLNAQIWRSISELFWGTMKEGG